MKVIAHRGYWEKEDQQNTFDAIFLGLVYADGVEIDLRLHDGKIIISHDHQIKGPYLYLENVLPLSLEFPDKWWALNIKEDGMTPNLKQSFKKYPLLQYFCFDMSFPETYIYVKQRLKIASRVSDLEKENKFITRNSIFYVQDHFNKFIKISNSASKKVMIISPELHCKEIDLRKFKKFLKTQKPNSFLCTDRVSEIC